MLTETDLDTDSEQGFMLGQEAIDDAADKISLDSSDFQWSANSKRIKNVAAPTADTDAVNKAFISTNLPNITTVAGISSDVTTVAGISADVTAVAADATDIGTVAGKATEIGLLGTADAVADMAILATADVVADMNTLATADIVADMNTLGTADVVADMNTLGTADVVNDMNVLGTSGNVTNMNTLAGISSDITTVAGISANTTTVAGIQANVTTVAGVASNVTTVAGIASNVTAVAGDSTDIGTVAGSIASVNTVASNISGVNSFGERYRVGSSYPASSNDAGDLAFNTAASTFGYYDGSNWQSITAGGITSLAGDATPQLGGDLDLNLNDITGTGNINITGGVTMSGDLTVNGTTTTINSTTMTVDDKNMVLASGAADSSAADGSGITIDGASAELKYVHSGTKWTVNKDFDVTGNIIVSGTVDGVDIATRDAVLTSTTSTATTANTTASTANTTANAALPKAGGTMTGDLILGDDVKIEVGSASGGDLEIYHDSSNNVSFIHESGSSSLNIRGGNIILKSQTDNDDYIKCIEDGAVELYHDNTKKLETTATGATVTGTLAATTLDGLLDTGAALKVGAWYNDNGTSAKGRFWFSDGGTTQINTAADIDFSYETANKARIESDGDFICVGNITAYGSLSDEKLKENIEIIPNALDKVSQLKGVTFDYKKDGKRSTGLIAQDLQKVLPEVVYETKDIVNDNESYLAVNYENTVGLLVEAIKELKSEIDNHKAKCHCEDS